MDSWIILLLAGLTVFFTFTLEGISGFGSTVMALPFLSMLLGVEKTVPLLSALSIVLSLFILSCSWRSVNVKEYLFIVLHVGLGIPAGLILMDHLPQKSVLFFLIVFMFFSGIRGLLELRNSPQGKSPECRKTVWDRVILWGGGLIQGMFSSGGPVIIIYAAKALCDKSSFRATLTLLWLTANTVIVTKLSLINGIWTPDFIKILLSSLPFITAGMLLGNKLHGKVNQHYFKILVYAVLLFAGCMLTFSLLRN